MFSCLKFNLWGESEQFRPNCFGPTFPEKAKPASQTTISLNSEEHIVVAVCHTGDHLFICSTVSSIYPTGTDTVCA